MVNKFKSSLSLKDYFAYTFFPLKQNKYYKPMLIIFICCFNVLFIYFLLVGILNKGFNKTQLATLIISVCLILLMVVPLIFRVVSSYIKNKKFFQSEFEYDFCDNRIAVTLNDVEAFDILVSDIQYISFTKKRMFIMKKNHLCYCISLKNSTRENTIEIIRWAKEKIKGAN